MPAVVALTLPESLDPETLRTGGLVVLVVLVLGALWVLRAVQKAMTRLLLLGLCVLLGVGVWFQREELGECRRTCECQLFFQDVEVPERGNGSACDI